MKKITKITLIIVLAVVIFFENKQIVSAQPAPQEITCGNIATGSNVTCGCPGGKFESFTNQAGVTQRCCGWVQGDQCTSSNPKPDINAVKGPDDEFFDTLNPLVISNSPYADDLSTPGGIISRLLLFLFPLAGLILFVMIVWGGFEILAKASDSKKALDAGKNRITAAIVGFLLLFASYWLVQIAEVIFGITIL